ncbi:MAG: glucans biosynthesis glucosyltransferase MdoH [Chthoniobacterales bacterium]
MNPYPSQTAERTLTFPDVGRWSRPASQTQTRSQHRFAFTLLIGMLTLLAATFEWSLLAAEALTPLNLMLFGLFILLFTHVAIGFAQAFFGFLILSDRGTKPPTAALPSEQDLSLLPVSAIVIPIYNEDVGPVFARLQVMHDALRSVGALERFQFFVLSDSTKPEKALEEKQAWTGMVSRCDAAGRVFYRRRKLPLNRKSGNIADFCRRWGSQYRYMICLDADSLMSAPTLIELVRRMEENHRIGILQTVPQAINGRTIWSRLQQFSMSLYGPIFAAGANFWQQEESNFWGHNAIIRLTPFIQHCALPALPGKSAIGRRPMSHDFVEAALMRRAGWEVHLAEDLEGSFEETPPTVIEHLKRDRRWCQGNLQHWPLALARGFKPVTRFHFLHGIFSFLASPLLILVLVLGFLKNLGSAPLLDGFFADTARTQIAVALFSFTMLLLLAPKFLGLALALRCERAEQFGGPGRLMASAALEMIVSILIAPVFLYFHAKFVLFSLLGKKVEWNAQQRESATGLGWREAHEVFGLTTLLGLLTGLLAWWATPDYFLWLLPIVLGWVVAIPLTALVGDAQVGQRLRQAGGFLVPSEVAPPNEVHALRHALIRRDLSAQAPAMPAVLDPFLHRIGSGLTTSSDTLRHRQLWTTPAAHLPATWREEFARLERRGDPAPQRSGSSRVAA